MDDSIQLICDECRAQISEIGRRVRKGMDNHEFQGEQMFQGQHAEMKANLMLAFRHLEDARMRLGKVLQAKGGGKSIYDA